MGGNCIMLGLDYNNRVSNETQRFPLSYFHVDEAHPAYRAPLHWHHQPELVRVISGSLKLYMNGEKHVLSIGDIMYINSETIHGFVPKNCVYDIINFDIQEILLRSSLCKNRLQLFTNRNASVFPSILKENESIYRIATQLFDVASSDDANYDLIKLGALYEFLGIVFTSHHYTEKYTESNHARILKPVLNFIEDSYMNCITLSDMVEVSKLSTSHFITLFHTLFRQTPIDYLNSYRIEQASAFLINSELSVTEIAQRCGFNDSAYFTKVFKRYKNITPKKYRTLFTSEHINSQRSL